MLDNQPTSNEDNEENNENNEQLNTTDKPNTELDTSLTNENESSFLADKNSVVPLNDESPPLAESVSALEEAPPSTTEEDRHLAEATARLNLEQSNENADEESQASNAEEESQASPSNDDNISKQIDNEHPSEEEIDTISLSLASTEEHSNGHSNGADHATLNDSNNNKDFLVEDRSAPLNAWNGVSNESHGNGQKLVVAEGDAPYLNGSQDDRKSINGSVDVTILPKSDDNTKNAESEQWNKFDDRMNQISPTVVDQSAGNDENKLWKV